MVNLIACSLVCLFAVNSLFARQISSASLPRNDKISQNDTIRLVQLIANARTFEEINPDSTYYYAEQSLVLSRKLNIKLEEGRALLEMGYALMNRGNYPQALQTILTALEILDDPESEKNVLIGKFPGDDAILDRTSTPHAQRLSEIAFAHQILGLLYTNIYGYEKSWQHHLLARQKAEQAGNVALLSTINLTLNRVYLELGKTDSALISIQNSYDQTVQSGYLKYLGSVLMNTGRTYAAMGNTSMATEYYRKSLEASAEHGYFRGVVAGNLLLADYYYKSGKTDSAYLYILDALAVAQKLDNPDLLLRSYSKLTRHHQGIGNIDSLVKYQSMIIKINEDLFNSKQAQEFQNIDFNAQLQRQQILAAEKEYRNRQQKNMLFGGLGVFLIIATILFRNNRQKQKTNKILGETLADLKSTQAQLIESEKMASLGQLRLSELDAVKTRLYTNITHEFRTPLTVILGISNQILENPNDHLRNGLKMIMRNGQNLLTLVNQMLDLSKMESGKLSLQYHHADVISFLGYIIDGFHSLAESKGIQIHFISVKDQLNMDFDEVRLQQIVSNIISNAIKFTPKGGHVYISTDTKDCNFFLKIKDTGVGIADADLRHIFDRFYQADDSHTRHGEGTGIGLSLTHELVKLMQGSIAVRSRIGHGTEFEVMLPIRIDTNPNEKTDQVPLVAMDTKIDYPVSVEEDSPGSLISLNHSENGSPHVLIVDDNEDVLAFVASCLENEFHVELARNGQQCEDLTFKMIPDLIVMDVMMPFKDGFEVCKTLKTDERTSHIPIILLTAKADLDSRLDGLEQGADDYLTKPFHKKELLLRVKNLLDLRRQLQQYYRSILESRLSANSLQNLDGSNINSEFNGLKEAHSGNQNPSIPIASSLENSFVIKVRKAIEANLEEPDFDVEKLCRDLALSHSQVHRKLSALTGLSATHFIRYVRLLKAKEMILDSGFSIAAIAYDCGFNDPAYFSRIFKQEFGMSPQVWREHNSG